MKPSDPSSASTTQKWLNTYFVIAIENGKVMKQSEPMIDNL